MKHNQQEREKINVVGRTDSQELVPPFSWTTLRRPIAMLPDRNHPVHFPPVNRLNRSTIIFLTVCTRGRKRTLANPAAVAVILDAWREAGDWMVGRYVILPDHLHLFCAPAVLDAPPLKAWVAFWRSLSTRAWPYSKDKPVWQKEFWDTQLRKGDSYSAKWDYVRRNPVRHRLVSAVEDWPWQGELTKLIWHD